MLTFLFFVFAGICIAGLVKPIVRQKIDRANNIKSKREWVSIWVVLFLFCAMLSTCVGDDDNKMPEGNLEARIKYLAGDVTDVRETGDLLQITHLNRTVYDEVDFVWGFASDAKNIFTRLNEASKGKKYKTIGFYVKTPTINNLGQESNSLGMEVYYDTAELKGANYRKMNEYDFLEVASDYQFRRLGRESAIQFCKQNSNAKFAPKFCHAADNLN